MADIIRLRGNPHEEVQELLPWLVTGTLSAEDRELAEAHLADCAECRAELETERKLASSIATLPVTADSSWEAMEKRLNAEPRFQARQPSGLWRRRVPLGWAVLSPLAAAAAVAVLFIDVIPRQPANDQYRALGAAGASQAANIVVLFAPDTKEATMRSLLDAADARLVDGPTETGAYLLRVEGTKREQALKRLRDNGAITLAEPIDGAARS
jgi:anti-sigma factor RsiW